MIHELTLNLEFSLNIGPSQHPFTRHLLYSSFQFEEFNLFSSVRNVSRDHQRYVSCAPQYITVQLRVACIKYEPFQTNLINQ